MIAQRISLGLSMALFLAVALACSGSGNVGERGTGKSDFPNTQTEPNETEPNDQPRSEPVEVIRGERDRWHARAREARRKHREELEASAQDADEALVKAQKNRKTTISNGTTVNKLKAIDEQIATLKRNRDQLQAMFKASDWWEPRISPLDLQVGNVVKLGDGDGAARMDVFQVVSDSAALLEYRDRLFWVEMNTRGLTDKSAILLTQIVKCTGTRSYVTALGGTRTVLSLRLCGE